MSLLLFWTSSSAGGITGSGSADGILPTVSGVGERTIIALASIDGIIPTLAGVGERVIIGAGSADGLVALVSGVGIIPAGSGSADGILPTISGVGERVITGSGSVDALISLVTGLIDSPGQFVISKSIRVGVSDEHATLGAVNDDPIAKYVNIQGL